MTHRRLKPAIATLSNLLRFAAGKITRSPKRANGEIGTRFMIGYALLVSDEVHNYMRRLQLNVRRNYGDDYDIEIFPHITLKQAFAARDVAPLERYFDRLAAEIEPFEVTMRDIGFFEDGVVFMDVVQSGPLDALRNRILADLRSQFGIIPNDLEDDRYHFHATLAQRMPPECLERLRQELRDERVEFRFSCATLALLLHTGREWIIYKRSSVGATKPDCTDDEV